MSAFDSDAFNQRLFFPRRASSPTPPGARDLRIPVEGFELHLRWHLAEGTLPIVLLFHGNGEVVADYDGELADRFGQSGASLAVVDYRGYGESTGSPTLRALIQDVRPVLDAIRPGARKLFVMGRSLGSACAIELYGRAAPGVAGFIIDSGWSRLAGLLERRGLKSPITAEDLATFDPLSKLGRGTAPLLVLHGGNDTLISPDEGREIFAAAASPQKAIEVFEGFGHNDLFACPDYWRRLEAFLR